MTSTPQPTNTIRPADITSAPSPAVQAPNSSTALAPSFSTTASPSGRSSYASATKGGFPPNASEPPNMSAAAGARPPADSISPVNGRNPTIPAVPSVGGPTIVNGNSTDHIRKPSFTVSPGGATTTTTTTTTNLATNGGAVGGGQSKANNIQFGSIPAGGSPALNNPPALASQSPSSLGIAPANPRVVSPQKSPSPIPQPAASGGRLPSNLQGQSNELRFGQLGGDPTDANRPLRPMPQGPVGPGSQPPHLRRDSSQSSHEGMASQGMSAGPGRGGYPMGGRGRGYSGQFNPPMAYSQPQNFGRPQNGRGMPNMQFQGRPQVPYPGSPNLATRSPAAMSVNPATPQMGQVQMMPGQHNGYQPYMGAPQVNRHFLSSEPPKPRGRGRDRGGRAGNYKGKGASNFNHSKLREDGSNGEPRVSRDPASQYYHSPPPPALAVPVVPLLPPPDLSPESGNFEQFLTMKNQAQIQYTADPSIQAMYHNHWVMQQQQMQGYPPPQSPRPPFVQGPSAPFMQPSYSGQGQLPQQSQSLSRTSSQMSVTDRPNSSLGQPQPPSLVSATGQPPLSRQSGSPAPKPSFTLPPKKSAAIVIKNAQGDVVNFSKPTPSAAHATPSPVKAATPPAATPARQSASTPDPIHSRTDSVSTKTNEEKKREMQEAVAKKLLEEAKAKQDKEEAGQEEAAAAAQEKEAADAAAAAAAADDDDDDAAAVAKEAEAKATAAKEADLKAAEANKAAEASKAEAELARTRDVETSKAESTQAREAEIPKAKDEAATAKTPEPGVKDRAETEARQKKVPEAPALVEKGGEDEIDYEALEAEFAAQEAAELAKEAEYQRKKEAEREGQKQREREEQEAYEANMKQMEREAEEREEALARKKAEEGSDSEDSKKLFASLRAHDAPDAPTPDSNASPVMQTPAESGTATPVSDISMGPPARGKKDRKPAELTLNTTKAVEPPQPSAALKSLKSARFLEDPTSIEYPSTVASPNPALNTNAPADKKFKYDKEFLLQFQSVFKEKPSIDWDARVRETLGDGGESTASARPSSARTPSGMGGRSISNRPSVVPGSFGQMGTFGAPPRAGPTQLPPGTTSAQRFAMSNTPAPSQRNPMPNPFEAFGRPVGTPLTGPSMSRTASSNVLGGIPPSPRVGGSTRGGGGGGGTRDGSKRGKQSNRRHDDEDKSMPLTAGIDVGPIKVSQAGWKPRSLAGPAMSGPALGGDGLMPPDVVQRKVKSNLNKMTPEKFDKISDQILEIAAQSKDESDGRTLRQVIQLTFEKATDEAHWASMYAMFCKRMLESMSPDIKDENIKDKHGAIVTGGNLFRKYLLNRCQEEFEQGWKVNLPPKPEGQAEEAAMLSDEYYIAAAAKRRGLGLVKFIGELYKLGMLTERIMHECVKKLLDYDGVPDEAEIESLTGLLKTVGANLDDPHSKAQPRMDAYFERMQAIMEMPELPSRLRFMIMDVIDLRKKNWQSKEDNRGPKTIQEIHAEAQRAEQEKEMQRLANQTNRTGGRMPMSRGDARSFSYNQMPPPDHSSSRVGTDELRKLGSRSSRNASHTSGPGGGFGPTSLLGGRTNSGRRNLGPGGSLLAQREDSAGSSRAGTPPVKEKEKKDESSTNAFSALAALEGTESTTSPPSTASSPPTTKSRPNIEQERSASPDKSKE